MFDKEIKFISDVGLNKLTATGTSFTYDKLLHSDLHPAIIKFVSAKIDLLIKSDREKLLSKSIFDYTGSGMARYFQLIGEEIKRTHRFTTDQYNNWINEAVKFNLNYIVQPKQTLINFIFENKELKSIEEIKDCFDFVYYYNYLKEILFAYLAKVKVLNLGPSELEIILNKIDRELYTSYNRDELINDALTSMADFFNIGAGDKKISLEKVELFLIEKNLAEHLTNLKLHYKDDARQKFEVDDIRKILFQGKPSADFSETEKEIKPETEKRDLTEVSSGEAASDFKKEIEKEAELKDTEEIEFDITNKDKLENLYEFSEPEPEAKHDDDEISIDSGLEIIDSLGGDFEKDNDEILKEKRKQEEKIRAEEKARLNEKLSAEKKQEKIPEKREEIQFEDEELEREKINLQEQMKEQSRRKFPKDIFSFLTDKEIQRVVASIFNDDKDDFANSMEKISECRDYDEATEIIKNIFIAYQVNPYSRDAVLLTNAVSNYFDQ